MSKLTSDLYGKKIKAKDGRTGYLHDLSISEQDWSIRFFVCKRRLWFPWAKNHLPEESFSRLIGDMDSYFFSKQDQANGTVTWRSKRIKENPDDCFDPVTGEEASPLLSSRCLKGYSILAKDGTPGKVCGLLVNLSTRQVSHLVVENGNWRLSCQTMIDPGKVSRISHEDRSLTVDLRMDEIGCLPKIADIRRMTHAMRIGWWRVTA